MTERTIVSSEIILKLPRHAKLRFDKARDKWIILAPERVFELDEIAYEVPSLGNDFQNLNPLWSKLVYFRPS